MRVLVAYRSHVEIGDAEGVGLNEVAAGFDEVALQGREVSSAQWAWLILTCDNEPISGRRMRSQSRSWFISLGGYRNDRLGLAWATLG